MQISCIVSACRLTKPQILLELGNSRVFLGFFHVTISSNEETRREFLPSKISKGEQILEVTKTAYLLGQGQK